MERNLFFFILIVFLAVSGCLHTNQNQEGDRMENDTNENAAIEYKKITQEEAKKIIDSGNSYILLDVRTQQEYDEKHIVGARLIPLDRLRERAPKELTDKDALIMVYCRSGVRSQNASKILIELGYTNVFDIGGIITWNYETE